MKQIKFHHQMIVIGLICFATAPAFAKQNQKKATKVASHTKPLEVLSSKEMKKLSHQQRILYVTGLRELLKDLEQHQYKKANQSATQPHSTWQDMFAWLNPSTPALASEDEKKCIYAAYLNDYQKDGKWCQHPPSENCTVKDHVQCHPLIFGEGVCVPKHPRATELCEKSGQPVSEIVGKIEKNWSQWDQYVKKINSFCQTGKQQMECGYIQARVAQIHEVIDQGPPVQAKTTAPQATDSQPVYRSTMGSRELSSSPVNVDTSSVASQCQKYMNHQTVCNPQALIEEAETPFDRDNSSSARTVMDFHDAYSLGCQGQTSPLSVSEAKRELRSGLAKIGRGGGEKGEYYRRYLCRLEVNLARCEKRAGTFQQQSLRPSYHLKFNGELATLYSSNNRAEFMTHKQWIGRSLNTHGISLCDVKLSTPTHRRQGSPARTTQ